MNEDLRAAVAGGVLAGDELNRALLQSVVDTARAIFSAEAASIFLIDDAADELVFEAVSGRGSGELLGRRFPADTGIAGWVAATRQPLVVADAHADPRFAREAAESTGYVPRSVMAVPLLHEDRALGVLSVLDRSTDLPFTLAEMDLLGRFANQAAIGLELLVRARRARLALEGRGELEPLIRLAERLDELPDDRRREGLRLLELVERLLGR